MPQSKTTNIIEWISFSIVLAIISYFFFFFFDPIISTDRLLILDDPQIFNLIIISTLIFIVLMLVFAFFLAISKNPWITLLIPVAYITANGFALFSIVISIFLFGAIFWMATSFLSDLDNFKRPSLSRCIKIAFGSPLTALVILMVLNFYPIYSGFVNSEHITIDPKIFSAVNNLTKTFGSLSMQGLDQGTSNQTVDEYAKKLLSDQNLPLTQENITAVEQQIQKQFGGQVQSTDKIGDIEQKNLEDKVASFIEQNRTLALIIIVVGMVILAQGLVKFASFLAHIFIFIVERIFRAFGVRFYDEYVEVQKTPNPQLQIVKN